jgi:hypothetical protein
MQNRTKFKEKRKVSTDSLNTVSANRNKKLRFNLSPEHQHVRASFKDTSKAVAKLR